MCIKNKLIGSILFLVLVCNIYGNEWNVSFQGTVNPGELSTGVFNIGTSVEIEYSRNMFCAAAGVLVNSVLFVPDAAGLGTKHITINHDVSIMPLAGAGILIDTEKRSERFYLVSAFDFHTVKESITIESQGVEDSYSNNNWIWRPGLLYVSHNNNWNMIFYVPFTGWPLDALQQMYLGIGTQIRF